MKTILLLVCFILLLSSGCGLRSREEALNEKEAQLSQKEQELLLKEKSLQIREDELNRRDDSSAYHQAAILNDTLLGIWGVQMVCTETTCAGSAIGDTKTETWEIIYESSRYIAKAMSDKKLVRVYSGSYNGNTLELAADRDSTAATPTIEVRLDLASGTEMQGTRIINRENDCRIVYAMTLKRQ